MAGQEQIVSRGKEIINVTILNGAANFFQPYLSAGVSSGDRKKHQVKHSMLPVFV